MANKNAKCIDYDYVIRDKMLIVNEGVGCKARDKHIRPFPIIQVHSIGTVTFSMIT